MNQYPKITDYLSRCIEIDALSHAYIFYGPDELAKKNIALKFAAQILNADAEFCPDLMLISADDDEDRSINMVRQLKKFLTLSSYSGKYKIAIVEKSEKLNPYAQNAMLKIFEEMPRQSIIILCARTADSIPKTIVSRGIKLPFWQKSNPEPFWDEKIIKNFNDILNNNLKSQHYNIEKFNNFKAIEIFRLWLGFLRNKFSLNPNKKLAGILKISQNIYFKLNETNINPKLAYDELILNLWKF